MNMYLVCRRAKRQLPQRACGFLRQRNWRFPRSRGCPQFPRTAPTLPPRAPKPVRKNGCCRTAWFPVPPPRRRVRFSVYHARRCFLLHFSALVKCVLPNAVRFRFQKACRAPNAQSPRCCGRWSFPQPVPARRARRPVLQIVTKTGALPQFAHGGFACLRLRGQSARRFLRARPRLLYAVPARWRFCAPARADGRWFCQWC